MGVSRTIPNVIELLRSLEQIVARIPADFGGSSPISKTFVMAYLALTYDLKNYVEIGVYRGRSFFPMAHAARLAGGMAYGIDSYDDEIAREYDRGEEFGQQVNSFVASLDFAQIYEDVKNLRKALSLVDHAEIIKAESTAAAAYFRENQIPIDMLHLDGNHNTKQVLQDVESYLPLMREGGFVVLDDIGWDPVKPAYERLKERYEVVFDNRLFAVLSLTRDRVPVLHKHRLYILHSLVENAAEPRGFDSNVKVSVAVTTYNHEKYIAECLDGIFAQKIGFALEVVISDDGSSDRTLRIIQDYAARFGSPRFDVKILSGAQNIGMTKNLQRTLAACTGQYIALCEGDDAWTDPEKLNKQVDFLKSHPDCAFCFHDFYMYFQETDETRLFDLQENLDAEVLETRDLILDNVIGNFSCCMYDARFMENVRPEIFDIYIADWMFNISYSRSGKIGHLKETLSMYRKHSEGLWTGKMLENRGVRLYWLIEDYNKFLNYEFDAEFSTVQKRIVSISPEKFNKEPLDIAVIDDAFPHPLSAFRLQEFTSYLSEFPQLRVYCTGEAVHWLGQKTLDDIFRDFKRSYPEFAPRIERWTWDTVINTKLFYFVFVGNTYRRIDVVEKLGVPFVFTLYPGSLFAINNEQSDMMLRRITSSPCFRKVIVTQKITRDYLIKKKFCRPDQIESIFGVVTPLEQMGAEYTKEKRYGLNKSTLDICFVAHKYTPTGVDKGYDVFVDVARELCRRYEDIRFHVVGGFDRDVIDVTDLQDCITFYGRQEMDWFDEFYKDKDIILSPNIPFANPHIQGSFDGFPTASCVDAGLRKTAIFCTDELGLNTEFTDRKEIVIIPHDAAQVTDILEHYYLNPREIEQIAEQGCQRIRQIYGYEGQILPRIRILKAELEQAERHKPAILRALEARRGRARMGQRVLGWLSILKRITPAWIKNLLRWAFRKLRSQEGLYTFLKKMTPDILLRLFVSLRRHI